MSDHELHSDRERVIDSTAADGKTAEEVIFQWKEEEESVRGLAWG